MSPPDPFNAARYCLEENARRRGDRAALVIAGAGGEARRISFGEMDRAVRSAAAGLLGLGLRPGTRIMIRMGNEAAYPILFFGAMAAGLVAQPSSVQLTPAEAAFLLADSGAAVVAVGAGCAVPEATAGGPIVLGPAEIERLLASEPLPAYAETRADDPAYLIYTSGTSSRPKGVVHAHRAVWGRRPMHGAWLGLRESDIVLHAGAMNWTYTLGVGMMDPWACGATSLVYEGPRDPAIWPALIERFRATIFAAVPSVYRQMLKYADLANPDLSSLRHGVTAGEALSPALLAEWREATGKPLFEALGMSEISTYVSSGPDTPVRPGSPGRPQPGRRVAVLPVAEGTYELPTGETGLLAVHRSDPSLMLGYWNRPDEQAAVFRGDWFLGGDLAAFDADGYLWYHGRGDDVMNAFGYRVSPTEVESVLARHPAVLDCAVTELPVGDGIRVIGAFVLLREDAPADREDLLAFCAGQLAAYKCPRELVFIDALPRTPNGKVQRKRLVAAWEGDRR